MSLWFFVLCTLSFVVCSYKVQSTKFKNKTDTDRNTCVSSLFLDDVFFQTRDEGEDDLLTAAKIDCAGRRSDTASWFERHGKHRPFKRLLRNSIG